MIRCAHAIVTPQQVLVVEDATKDPRFADTPLVTGPPGLRFHAGAAVRSPSGPPVGTPCIIDTAPRTVVHELGAVSIAEGVETREQAALLKSLGFDAMRGWHFGMSGTLPTAWTARDAA